MTKTTYIIPIRIESPDRERNVTTSVKYLIKNTDGRIIIKECARKQLIPQTLGSLLDDKRITYLYEEDHESFHRTKLLNDMIELVETPIVCNYDADVILPPESYRSAEKLILDGNADAVYPYPHSSIGQVQVFFDSDKEAFFSSLNIDDIAKSKWRLCWAHAGFCVFVKTKAYIKAGGEHEGFVSYGPEDGERILRLKTMGLSVKRLDNGAVYHMEHSRTHDSSSRNPHFSMNYRLYDELSKMTKEQLSNHLKDQSYVARRGWKEIISCKQ